MKRKLLRVVVAVLLALTMATPVLADAGGGPVYLSIEKGAI